MTKGGYRANNKVECNHLFKPKWRLGKTAAIRIPAILKDKLLDMAKYLDNKPIKKVLSIDIVKEIENNIELNKRTFELHNETVKLNRENNMLTHINEDLRKQLDEISKKSQCQIAIEYFEKYLKSQNLNMEELSKSRKGSKKHLLFEVDQWLKSQDSNNA